MVTVAHHGNHAVEPATPQERLVALIAAAIAGLAHLRRPVSTLAGLERCLRAAVEVPGACAGASLVAVRAACAYLARGEDAEAYFALLTARDLLDSHPSPDPTH